MKKILVILLLAAPFCLQAQTKSKVKSKPAVASGMPVSIARGQKLYTQYCLACHQADGGGVPTMNPPLIQTTYVTGDKVKLIKIVLNGFPQPVDINGESYSNSMPAQSNLTDQEIADVLTYVRNSFTNKSSQITAAQVKQVRAANKK